MKNLIKIQEKRDKAYNLGDYEAVAFLDQIINNIEKAKRLADRDAAIRPKYDIDYKVVEDEIHYFAEEIDYD